MRVNHSYYVKKINKSQVGITEKGKKQDIYRYKSMKFEDEYLVIELKSNRLYFTEDDEPHFYTLIDIEPLEQRKLVHLTKEKVREIRKQQLREYFNTHFDEIAMLKRYFAIEGVLSLTNMRYEMRRLLDLGYVYAVWPDDLYDILCEYGFKPVKR